jgi:hypothetical protein
VHRAHLLCTTEGDYYTILGLIRVKAAGQHHSLTRAHFLCTCAHCCRWYVDEVEARWQHFINGMGQAAESVEFGWSKSDNQSFERLVRSVANQLGLRGTCSLGRIDRC